MSLVLVAVPDETLRARVMGAAASVGLAARTADDEIDALRLMQRLEVAVVVIDVGDDAGHRERLLRLLRGGSHTVIATTPRVTPDAIVDLLRQGADHVVDADTTIAELAARLDAAARRAVATANDVLSGRFVRTGDLVVDRIGHTVTRCGEPLPLSHREFRLLDALAARVGLVATHNYLQSVLWGEARDEHRQLLRAYVKNVRAKLEDDPAEPEYILNEWGRGYRLADLPVVSSRPRVPVSAAGYDEPPTAARPGRPSSPVGKRAAADGTTRLA